MIVKWSERKQGSGPEGDEVLYNTGGLSFFRPDSIDEVLTGADSVSMMASGFPKD